MSHEDTAHIQRARYQLERHGLRPTGVYPYWHDEDAEMIGLYLALEFREEIDDYLATLPARIERVLTEHTVVEPPRLCDTDMFLRGDHTVVIRTRWLRQAA